MSNIFYWVVLSCGVAMDFHSAESSKMLYMYEMSLKLSNKIDTHVEILI